MALGLGPAQNRRYLSENEPRHQSSTAKILKVAPPVPLFERPALRPFKRHSQVVIPEVCGREHIIFGLLIVGGGPDFDSRNVSSTDESSV